MVKGSSFRSQPREVGDGVAYFDDGSQMETPATRAELDSLTREAAAAGWEAALKSVYASRPDLVRYATDTNRLRLLDTLAGEELGRVLEVGAGLGAFTATLASRGESVDALEVVPGQARFVAVRARQSVGDRVRVACGGASGELPYRDGAFDTVVMNLVLEWCGTRNPAAAEETQARLLRELRRVLRGGGRLLLTTKNRFAAGYLLGDPDEHWGGLRFGGLLPRALAGALAPVRPGGSRGLLHSRAELIAMAAAAGLGLEREWWALPDARYPRAYVPFDDSAAVRAARADESLFDGMPRSTAAVLRACPESWLPSLVPGLAFTLRKP